jgi:hypothetical protein
MDRMHFEDIRINADGGDIILVMAKPMIRAVSGTGNTRRRAISPIARSRTSP